MYDLLPIISFGLNFITLILVWVLDRRNKTMKKLIIGGYHLTTRYQIVENIRILIVIRPYIVLMTCVTIMGPIANRLALTITGRLQASVPLFYVFYNIYFILCSVISFKRRLQMAKKVDDKSLSFRINKQVVVITALGEKLPLTTTMDEHFNELKKGWS